MSLGKRAREESTEEEDQVQDESHKKVKLEIPPLKVFLVDNLRITIPIHLSKGFEEFVDSVAQKGKQMQAFIRYTTNPYEKLCHFDASSNDDYWTDFAQWAYSHGQFASNMDKFDPSDSHNGINMIMREELRPFFHLYAHKDYYDSVDDVNNMINTVFRTAERSSFIHCDGCKIYKEWFQYVCTSVSSGIDFISNTPNPYLHFSDDYDQSIPGSSETNDLIKNIFERYRRYCDNRYEIDLYILLGTEQNFTTPIISKIVDYIN